jgi:hypothetical protein
LYSLFIYIYIYIKSKPLKLVTWFYFFYNSRCSCKLARTTTISRVYWTSCKPSRQVRHHGGNRRAHEGSNSGRGQGKPHLLTTELNPQVQSLDLLMKVLYLFGLQGHFENKSYSCVNHVANSKDLDWKSSQKMNLTYTKKQFDYIKVEWVIHLKLILKNRSSHLISCGIELRKYEPVRTLLSPQEIMAFDLLKLI